MSNEISILLRVDGVTVVKKEFKETVAAVKEAGRALELEAAKRVAESNKIAVAMGKEAAYYGGTGSAAKSAAVFMHAEIEQREQSLETIRNAVLARTAEAKATEQTALRMRAAMAATFAEEKRQAANSAALQAFKIKTIGENVDAEIVAQAKINRLHAAALAEDISRERARTAAIIREREKAAAAQAASVRNFGTGLASYAGMGAGANALGVGIAAGAGAYFASSTSIELERARKAIEAVTGSLTVAQQQMRFVEREAERMGASVTDTAMQWSRFEAAAKGTNLEGAKSREVFLSIETAAQKLNLRADQTEGVLVAITQMMSKGKIQAEELRGQLGDRLPGAFNIMARSIGVTTAELDKMMKQGGVATDEVLPGFARELLKSVNADVNSRIEMTSANFTRLTNEIKLTAAAIGDELNPALSEMAGEAAGDIRYLRENRMQRIGLTTLGMLPGMAPVAVAATGYLARNEADRQAAIAQSDRDTGRLFTATPQGASFDTDRLLGNVSAATSRTPTPTGLGLLAPDTGTADVKRLAKLQKELDLLNEQSEVKKAIWEIEKGDLQTADAATKNAALALAYAKDRKRAAEDAVKADTKTDKADALELKRAQAEQLRLDKADLQRELAAEEADREAIRKQQQRNVLLDYELRTGVKITSESQKQLILLQAKYATYASTTLAAEVQAGADKENALALLDDLAKIDALADKTTDHMSAYAKRAAENMQDSFAEFLFDPFHDGLEGMLEGFTTMLQQMVAQVAAQHVFDAAGGIDGVAGFIGGILGGWGSSSIGGSGIGALDMSQQSATGPIVYGHAAGGYIYGPGGPTEDKVPAWLSNGEYVLNARATKTIGKSTLDRVNAGAAHFAAGGMVGASSDNGTIVQVINNTSSEARTEKSTTQDGREVIRVVIGELNRDVSSNGPFSRNLSQSFGLSRQPYQRGGA